MKKLIAAVVCLFILPVAALAEYDFSALTYDELVSVSKQIGNAIMSHADFDSVSVPQGVWQVGVDIPEGVWILSSTAGRYVSVVYGSRLDESGNAMNQFNDGNVGQDLEDDQVWRVNAKAGNYFQIKYNNVTFTSDAGTTSLGFKKK